MATQKDRRQNGYISPKATISKKDLLENDLFIIPIYDDWKDYRDGVRDWFRDFKKIKKIHFKRRRYFCIDFFEKRIRMNLKQKKLLKRRRAQRGRGFFLRREKTAEVETFPL